MLRWGALGLAVMLASTASGDDSRGKQERPAEAEKKERAILREAIPLPEATPFDEHPALRERFIAGYRQGYFWGANPDKQSFATTNPDDRNGPAIRGWIAGWQAAVKAAPVGQPVGDLPAKYAQFVQWDQAAADAFVAKWTEKFAPKKTDWEDIREARFQKHDAGTASEFPGRWQMTLPAGFQHEITITQRPDGLLVWEANAGINLIGTFALAENRMLLVEPCKDTIHDFVWRYLDGRFVLESEDHRSGANYVGARLDRIDEESK